MSELLVSEVVPQSVALRALGLKSNRHMYGWDVWTEIHAGVRWYLAEEVVGMGGELNGDGWPEPFDIPFSSLMSRSEVMSELGLSHTAVWQMAKDGAIGTVKYTGFRYQLFVRDSWK